MNNITKRVPRDPSPEQIQTAKDTAEAMGFQWTGRMEQMLLSVYAGMVSSAPNDPLEEYFESVVETSMGRRVA